MAAANVAQPPGRVIYTQMLNDRGGIECDLTVTRLEADAYYLVTGTGFATHDVDWIRRQLPAGADVRLDDVTSAFAVLPLMGPRGANGAGRGHRRRRLATPALPFAHWRAIRIAGAPVRALRITYVGELGYELHVPTEFALTVFEALIAGGPTGGPAPGRLPRDRIRSGWRRATVPGAPTSVPTTRRWRRASASRSICAAGGPSVVARRCCGSGRPAWASACAPSPSTTRRSSCSAARPSIATAGRSAG